MRAKSSALLVHTRNDRFEVVRDVLETLSVATQRVRTCEELETRLGKARPPHLILADAYLPDGKWGKVLDLATRAPERVNVVVVSAVADIDLYIDVMTHGAYDFITDTFTVPELVHVLRCAIDDAVRWRGPERPVPARVFDEPVTES